MLRVLLLAAMVVAAATALGHPDGLVMMLDGNGRETQSPGGGSGPAAIVAILDTGINPLHREFERRQVVAWIDLAGDESGRKWTDPYDDQGHGTAVASRAAGRTIGAFPFAKLAVAKVADRDGVAREEHIIAGLRWAVDVAHASVISVSLWSPVPRAGLVPELNDAIDHAVARGALVVWIAGNGYAEPSELLMGSSHPRVLVVGAVDEGGRRPAYSNLDPEVVAAGDDVPIARHEGDIGRGSGTSYAAPYVAGGAARVMMMSGVRDATVVKHAILNTARDNVLLPYAIEGYGMVDAATLSDAIGVAAANGRGGTARPVDDATHTVSMTVRNLLD